MEHNKKIEELAIILANNHKLSFSDIAKIRTSFADADEISFEEFLLDQSLVDKSDLLQALGTYYKVVAIDVIGEFFDHYLLRLFPKNVLLSNYIIPYYREGDLLTVIAANPANPALPVIIGKHITHNVNFMVGIASDIQECIEEFYDQSDTYQPNDIEAQQMERSAIDVYPNTNDIWGRVDTDEHIPSVVQETIDDYERY